MKFGTFLSCSNFSQYSIFQHNFQLPPVKVSILNDKNHSCQILQEAQKPSNCSSDGTGDSKLTICSMFATLPVNGNMTDAHNLTE